MEIIVDIREGDNGRPVGTVRSASAEAAIPFSGNLEFMALIERLYRTADRTESRAHFSGQPTEGESK